MARYTFAFVVEPGDTWYAYCPALVQRGGATRGAPREEALANPNELIKMVVARLVEHGESTS